MCCWSTVPHLAEPSESPHRWAFSTRLYAATPQRVVNYDKTHVLFLSHCGVVYACGQTWIIHEHKHNSLRVYIYSGVVSGHRRSWVGVHCHVMSKGKSFILRVSASVSEQQRQEMSNCACGKVWRARTLAIRHSRWLVACSGFFRRLVTGEGAKRGLGDRSLWRGPGQSEICGNWKPDHMNRLAMIFGPVSSLQFRRISEAVPECCLMLMHCFVL